MVAVAVSNEECERLLTLRITLINTRADIMLSLDEKLLYLRNAVLTLTAEKE
jgi:hypothetical protein